MESVLACVTSCELLTSCELCISLPKATSEPIGCRSTLFINHSLTIPRRLGWSESNLNYLIDGGTLVF